MRVFLAEVAQAFRSLIRTPGFMLSAILTLGLGMGASTAIFTLLRRVVLDPLPYPEASRLVRIKNPVVAAGDDEWNVSGAQFFYYLEHAGSFDRIGLYRRTGVNLLTETGPDRVRAAQVTAGMMDLLGAAPAAGRVITPADDAPGAPPAIVLSNGFWRRQFGGDPAVVGTMLRLDGRAYRVIGVMARGVELPPERGLPAGQGTDVWLPLQLDPAQRLQSHTYPGIARLAGGVNLEQAQAEVNRIQDELPAARPDVYTSRFFERFGFHTRIYPLRDYVVGDAARRLWILFGAVGLVLLIACANVVNLFLARIESRRTETAIRSALGAGTGGLLRLRLAESLLLAAGGGVLALLLGLWSIQALLVLAPTGIPRIENIRLDADTVGFVAGLILLVAVALAVLPALRSGAADLLASLRAGGWHTPGRERRRLQTVLLAGQVALALVLVTAAGLLGRSFLRLGAVDPGVDPHGVLTVQLYRPADQEEDHERIWRFYDGVLSRVQALPGVTAAGFGDALPLTDNFGCTVQSFGDPAVGQRLADGGGNSCAGEVRVTPGYFQALGIPLVAGRFLTRDDFDSPSRGSVVVSRAFAERFWPGEDPIGKEVRSAQVGPPYYRVVGVAGDIRGASLSEPPPLAIYYPIAPIPGDDARWGPLYLSVRSNRADIPSLLPALRRAVGASDPTIPLANPEEMTDLVDGALAQLGFSMTLLGIAALVALALAGVGLYGLVSYVVSRRIPEIGIRLALGARPGQVEGLVLRGAGGTVAVGAGIGLLGALMLTRILRSQLFEVSPLDPAAFLVAVVVLGLVAGLAAWLPARRAARVDPNVALKAE
ncbi:MAG: ABC transporter permease [Gemmatimonadales bacterium]